MVCPYCHIFVYIFYTLSKPESCEKTVSRRDLCGRPSFCYIGTTLLDENTRMYHNKSEMLLNNGFGFI